MNSTSIHVGLVLSRVSRDVVLETLAAASVCDSASVFPDDGKVLKVVTGGTEDVLLEELDVFQVRVPVA